MNIGIISDTHNLVRPEALAALAGADAIVHAGDIIAAPVIERLQQLAPVYAVRGNNDKGPWADDLPSSLRLNFDGVSVYVVHDIADLPPNHGCRVVITGHSHKPALRDVEGILWLNPGSAGPRRFTLPVSVALLWCEAGAARAEIRALM